MAAAGTDVSNFAGLNFTVYNATVGSVAGANTQAHNLSVTPTYVIVVPTGAAQAITLVSVDATFVNFTSNTTDDVQILAF